jgi:hypothetical protein
MLAAASLTTGVASERGRPQGLWVVQTSNRHYYISRSRQNVPLPLGRQAMRRRSG